MADFPISLDNLISFVRSLHGDGDALDNLTDAVRVAASIDEQSDALIGYFVDQARRAGASWSDIGSSMGVSKQAVQKRFVARLDLDDFDLDSKPGSRFTDRARHVVAFARVIAASAGADHTGAEHLSAALLSEPGGIAAVVIHGAGITDDALLAAFSLTLPDPGSPPPAQGQVPFADDAKIALRDALKAALRLGHNYIGTEHILLGLLLGEGETATTLEKLGLPLTATESAVKESLDKLTEWRHQGPES